MIGDVIAQLPVGAREAAVVHLFESGAAGRLNAAVAEQAGALYREVATPVVFSESLHATSSRFQAWKRVKDLLARLDPDDPYANLHANAIASAFAREAIATPEDAEQAFQAYADADAHLRGVPA